MNEGRSIYYDAPAWHPPIQVDDFLVAIGARQSNSVYHVAAVRPVPRPAARVVRYYLTVLKSDLLTAIRREPGQLLHTLRWNSRKRRT